MQTTRMMLLLPLVVTGGAVEAVVDNGDNVVGADDANVEVADGGWHLV